MKIHGALATGLISGLSHGGHTAFTGTVTREQHTCSFHFPTGCLSKAIPGDPFPPQTAE